LESTPLIDLDTQGFYLRLAAIADMANYLGNKHHMGPVGINWPTTFVKCQPELKVKLNCKYNYKRALCKDAEVIQGWFKLVENTKAKYSILDEDTYNFDESGFMMGMILTRAMVTDSER
jgi:hypothetical protein